MTRGTILVRALRAHLDLPVTGASGGDWPHCESEFAAAVYGDLSARDLLS